MKKAIALALTLGAFSALLFWSHTAPDSSADSSREAAASLAATLANNEAAHRFGVTPFSPGKGEITLEPGKWTWSALKGYGHSDLQATVVVAQGKSSVEISQTVINTWE